METIADIYVDGSHIKGTGKLGFGAWGTISGAYTGEFILAGTEKDKIFKKLVEEFPKEKFSNPTMELFGLFITLTKFIKIKNAKITVHQDYSGAINFGYLWSISSGKPRAAKAWVAKIPYIKYLVDLIDGTCYLIEQNGGSVRIEWVSGHSGNIGNDKSDALATSRTEKYISPFVENIKK